MTRVLGSGPGSGPGPGVLCWPVSTPLSLQDSGCEMGAGPKSFEL